MSRARKAAPPKSGPAPARKAVTGTRPKTRTGAQARTKVKVEAKVERATGRRDAEATRRRILEAATAEFAAHGFAGARVDRISRAAQSYDRMLYYHFGDKAVLFGLVLDEAYARLWEAEKALDLEQAEPEAGLRALVAFTWGYFVEHPEFVRLLNSENLQEGRNLRKSFAIGRRSSPFIAILTGLLRRGEAAGTFRSGVDPVHLYLTIASLAYFYVSNRHTLSHFLARPLMSPAERRRWLAHITEVVLASLRPPAEGAPRKAARRARRAVDKGRGKPA